MSHTRSSNAKQPFPLIDLAFGFKRCVLVAGSGRSGTTWIGQTLAHAMRSRLMFEPFLLDDNQRFCFLAGTPTHCDHHQLYLPWGPHGQQREPEIRRILQGRLRARWCDRFTAPGVYFRRVVKAVRANLMLDYIARRWPEIKIIYVVRDPRCVINSQLAKMRQGWKFQWHPAGVLNQPELMRDWLHPYADLLEQSSSSCLIQRQALKWCIENFIPYQCLSQHENVVPVSYDQLTRDTNNWNAIARCLADRGWSDSRFREAVVRRSQTSQRSQAQIAQRLEPLSELDASSERTIVDLVQRFGLDDALQGEIGLRRTA